MEDEVGAVVEHGNESAPGRERQALVGGEILGLEADVGAKGASGGAQQGDHALAEAGEIPISLGAAAGSGSDGTAVVEEGGDASPGGAVPDAVGQVEEEVEDAAVGALAAEEEVDLAFDVVGALRLGRQRGVGGGGNQEGAQDGARRIRGRASHGRSRADRGDGQGKGASSQGILGIGSEACWSSGIASVLIVAS